MEESPAASIRSLVDSVPEVISRIAPDGRFRFVSDAAADLYGLPPETLVGTSAFDLIDPAHHKESRLRLARLAETEGATERITIRVVRPDGTAIWADVTGRSVRDPATGELEIVSVAREATERLETERALDAYESRFQDMVEWLPAVVYEAETGPEGRFLYVSPQIEETLGYTPEEWLADPNLWRKRIHRDEVDQVLALEEQQMRESIERGARMESEYRMVHRSGRPVWVRDIARVSRGDDDSRFWRGVLIDISAERGAQLALADAHERHRGMIDSMPACSYRAERRAMGRWHFVSAQIKPLLGYTPEEWCADPTLWRASLHADDRERIEIEEQQQMEQPAGTEAVSEYRLRHRSGRIVAVRDRAILTRGPEGEQMIEGILTDISAERAAEAVADGLTDVYRLSCGDCRHTWASERVERCPRCSSQNVDGVSLNGTLRELAASRQHVEGLLDGIQKHLEALGTNLSSTITLSSGERRPG